MNPERIWAFSPGKGEFSARTSLTLSVIKISNKSNYADFIKNRTFLFSPTALIREALVRESCSPRGAVPVGEGMEGPCGSASEEWARGAEQRETKPNQTKPVLLVPGTGRETDCSS